MAWAIVLTVALALAVGALAFRYPDRALQRSAIAAACALAGPIVLGTVAAPFLGDGAGMGVAFILAACSALLLVGALAAGIGAAARHAWTALRDARG